MQSPFSIGGSGRGAVFSPRVPSYLFPSDEDGAAMEDWDDEEQYDNDDDDDSDDDGSPNEVGGFPPQVKHWNDVDYSMQPSVTVDKARRDIFIQFIAEHKFIRELFDKIKDSNSPIDKIVSLLYGPLSPVFQLFNSELDLTYDQFCRFLSSFYFSCRLSMNWRKMWDDEDLNTDRGFMSPDDMDEILDKMNAYHHGKVMGGGPFWQLLEDASNNTFKKLTPTKGEHKVNLTDDDDKLHFNRRAKRKIPLGEESSLKLTRHVRANAKGLVNHVLISSASGIIYNSKFERVDQSTYDCFMEQMRDLFDLRKTESTPTMNLSGLATLIIDRGYTARVKILAWWLSTGGDILGTMKINTSFLPYNSSKAKSEAKGKKSSNNDGAEEEAVVAEEEEQEHEHEVPGRTRQGRDKPKLVSGKGIKTVYSANAAYKFDTGNAEGGAKKSKTRKTAGGREQHLSCTAYVNGISSTVPLLMDSRKKKVLEWDLVSADPSRSAKYHDDDLAEDERYMMAFEKLIEEDHVPAADDDDSDNNSEYETHKDLLARLVEPVTMVQLCAVWFVCRALSMTSSSTHKLVATSARFITPDHSMRVHFENVLEYAGQLSLLPEQDRREGEGDEANDASDAHSEDEEEGASSRKPNDDDESASRGSDEEKNDEPTAAAVPPIIGNDEKEDESEEEDEPKSSNGGGEKRTIVMLAQEAGSDGSSGESDDDSEGDLLVDVEAFLTPFQPNDGQHDNNYSELQDDAIEVVRNKSYEFLCLCMDSIGAPKNRKKNTTAAIAELLYWMRLPDAERPMAYMTRSRLQTYAEEMELGHIPMLSRDTMIKRIVNELSSTDNDVGDAGDDLETALLRALLVGSIMKPLPDGKEEGQSKFTIEGQRVEAVALKKWGRIYDETVKAIYQPGLVQSRKGKNNESWRNAVRTSADGVVITDADEELNIRQNNHQYVLPVEVKARVTPNTFHKTRQRFSKDKENSLADMPGIGTETHNNALHHFNLFCDDPELRGYIPESKDRMQVLHHAVTYRSPGCFYIVADHWAQPIASLFVDFTDDDCKYGKLYASYCSILKWLYKEVLAQFWVPGEDVPEVPVKLSRLFKDPQLKHANLSEHSFRVFLGLFRALNVTTRSDLSRPYPPIARIVPLVVAYWNGYKHGSDTSTKLLDACQERIGKRSDVTVSCVRLLLQLGIQFHRLGHMITNTKPLEDFATLYHYRNAASKRSTFNDSLRTAQNKLLECANSPNMDAVGLGWSYKNPVEESEDEDAEDGTPQQAPSKSRRSSKRKATPVVAMPCAAVAGMTPGRGGSFDNPTEEFKKRCAKCPGAYVGNKYKDGKKERKRCHFCNRKGTQMYCYGCRRNLCLEPPLHGVDRQGKTYPKFFSIKVPTKTRGSQKIEEKEERGDLTCYLLAHQQLMSGEALRRDKEETDSKPAAIVSGKKRTKRRMDNNSTKKR